MITRKTLGKRVAGYEITGFVIMIVIIWLDEIIDIPHRLFGAAATPVNLTESMFETVLILVLGTMVVGVTLQFIKRVQFLEGLLAVCAKCKRIRVNDRWVPIEVYVNEHSEAEFTHSICPECFETLYGEEMTEQNEEKHKK